MSIFDAAMRYKQEGVPSILLAGKAAFEIAAIASRGGLPVVLPSFGLSGLPEPAWVAAHEVLAREAEALIAFELGAVLAPFGRIASLEAWGELLRIPNLVGAKHASLSRELEWQRLALRDRIRPEFRVFTGNDLAIDRVLYGSDYLLGPSTFAPDLFARRDRLFEAGDPAFFELNDRLQFLGAFAFRDPVPACKHDAALFPELRGFVRVGGTHPGAPRRPDSDREVLRGIAASPGVVAG